MRRNANVAAVNQTQDKDRKNGDERSIANYITEDLNFYLFFPIFIIQSVSNIPGLTLPRNRSGSHMLK